MTALLNIAEMELPELEHALQALGVRRFHARQIYRWVYQREIHDFDRMSDLSRPLRTELASRFVVREPRIVHDDTSTDATRKFLLELQDGRRIEAVFIPETPAMTFCVSTQVGCAMNCGFCLTGKMGLARNLTAGEIVGQVRVLARETGLLKGRFNVVFMGMGEPLHNYDQAMKALRILACHDGLAVSPRRITVSTVGVLPALERLAHEPLMPNLAVSLHATTEELRDALVPINRKYGLAELVDACRRFPLKRRNRITFEYVLLRNVNDTNEDAHRLAKLLRGVKAKVNLLPLNEAPGIPYGRPSEERISEFARTLAAAHLIVSVRKSRGRDIRAACGQLIFEVARPSPAQRLAGLMSPETSP